MAIFNGQLRSNEIFAGLFNMIISLEVFSDNFADNYRLVDKAKVDGSLYGDTKLYYSADVLHSTEWGKDGINANIICPLAWTAQLENFEKAYPEAFKANVKMPPMGHYGDPELEIGRVCVQLASPDFKYLSGETLTLEGGMGLRP